MGSPLGTFLCPPGYAGPSGLRGVVRDANAVGETARLVRRSAADRLHRRQTAYASRTPARALDPVVLVPGFMAGDTTLLLLSHHLRRLGHRTYRSTMHANVGCSQAAALDLERRIEAISMRRERKVTLVGHSLGGLLARTIAARRPDLVDGVVTMGSPMLAPGAIHPLLKLDIALVVALRRAGLGSMLGADCTSGDCARLSWEQSQRPLAASVPFTSIYSRRDGVVDWRSCLDPAAISVEVRTSHFGMAVDPVVFDLVAATLAANRVARRPVVSAQARLSVVPVASVG